MSDSDLRRYVDHVCDVCVRSKSSRSSHSGSLINDDRLCSTFAYDLQGPFNTPSLINENIYQFGIIEYKSRYVWSYFGTRKDQVYAIFRNWPSNTCR